MAKAIQLDGLTGVETRLEHVRTPRGRLYSWAACPPQAESCVLVCSSLFGDFTANYHRERTLGRALAAMGMGVVRFHYAGEGNSEGERQDMTFATLCADAGAVVDHARGLGFTRLAVLGTRLGSLVAAATVASMPSAPLALWEPVTDPLRFLVEAQRAKRMSRVVQDTEPSASDWQQELAETGKLDLLGYDVYSPLINSLREINLLDTIGFTPRPVFIGRFRGRANSSDPLAGALTERRFPVMATAFGLSESWWFHNEFVSDSIDLISATCNWIVDATGKAA